MTHVEILDAARDRAGGYKVDVSRGERIGRVSSEWFSRPADDHPLVIAPLALMQWETTEPIPPTAAGPKLASTEVEAMELCQPVADHQ